MTDEERAAAEKEAAEKADAEKKAEAARELAKAKAEKERAERAARPLTAGDLADLEASAVERVTARVRGELAEKKRAAAESEPSKSTKKTGGVLTGFVVGVLALLAVGVGLAGAAFLRRKGT